MQKTILLHGNNHVSNRGCQALQMTTTMILERYFPHATYVHANLFHDRNPLLIASPEGKYPQIYEISPRRNLAFYLWGANLCGCQFWGLPAPMKVKKFIKNLERAQNPGLLLALGGDNWSMDYGKLALYLFTEPFHYAARRHFPTVLWGASVGPFSRSRSLERKMQSLLRSLHLILVRESLSLEYLHSLDISENVFQVADPAFLLPVRPPKAFPDTLRKILEKGAVGLNLSPLLMRYIQKPRSQWMDRMVSLVVHLLQRLDYPLILIPHVMMEPEIFPDNHDFFFLQELHAQLPSAYQKRTFLYDARQDDCTQIKWVISRLVAFIGVRTHATIAALSSGVPTFSIGYSIKSRGINRDLFGHEAWMVPFSELDEKSFPTKIHALLQEKSAIQSTLAQKIPEMRTLAWKNGEYLQEMMGKL
ncbi:MAG: polysaccharide pyruvyl transferase family protein [Planctomycetia bacterium]|nr:polysaccharide pyruvyl transferase family protein [Planctomycetia bacterium]